MSLLRSIATIGSYTFASRLLGFVRDMTITAVVGAGTVFDAFIVAFKLPNLLRTIFAEGAFNAAFLPIFTKMHDKEGSEKAFHFANNVFMIMTIFLTFLCIVFIWAMPWVIQILAPGFKETPERLEMAIVFGKITFPYILFVSLSALVAAVLNALNRFSAAAFVPVILNVCMISALATSFFLAKEVGLLLVYSVTIAGALQLFFLLGALKRAGHTLVLTFPKFDGSTSVLWRKMTPGIISAGGIQINMLVGLIVSSLLPEGSISYCAVADRIYQLPLGIIGVTMGTALLPLLTKKIHDMDWEGVRTAQRRSLEFALFISVPCSLALMLISVPILTVLFQRSAFTSQDVEITSTILFAFSTGIPAYILIKVFSSGFFALADTKTPMHYALISVVINVLLNLTLTLNIGIAGIGWATSIAAWVNAFLLGRKLYQKNMLSFDKVFRYFMPKLILGCLLMGTTLHLFMHNFSKHLQGGEIERALFLALMIGSGSLVFIVASYVMGLITREDLGKFYWRKKRSPDA